MLHESGYLELHCLIQGICNPLGTSVPQYTRKSRLHVVFGSRQSIGFNDTLNIVLCFLLVLGGSFLDVLQDLVQLDIFDCFGVFRCVLRKHLVHPLDLRGRHFVDAAI